MWSDFDNRKFLLDRLLDLGYGIDQLEGLRKLINLENSDIYDVLLNIAYDYQPLSRKERAQKALIPLKKKFSQKEFDFINFILEKYSKDGIRELNVEKLPTLLELCYGSVHEGIDELGHINVIKN